MTTDISRPSIPKVSKSYLDNPPMRTFNFYAVSKSKYLKLNFWYIHDICSLCLTSLENKVDDLTRILQASVRNCYAVPHAEKLGSRRRRVQTPVHQPVRHRVEKTDKTTDFWLFWFEVVLFSLAWTNIHQMDGVRIVAYNMETECRAHKSDIPRGSASPAKVRSNIQRCEWCVTSEPV